MRNFVKNFTKLTITFCVAYSLIKYFNGDIAKAIYWVLCAIIVHLSLTYFECE